MKMVDEAIINHDCIYLLNRDQLKRSDNTGVILSIIRDHNGTMKVEELLSIVNENRTKIENTGEQLNVRELQLAIDDFENLALVKRSGDAVTITSKGRALILF